MVAEYERATRDGGKIRPEDLRGIVGHWRMEDCMDPASGDSPFDRRRRKHSPDVLGHMATSAMFGADVACIALLHPCLPPQAIREIFEDTSGDHNVERAVWLLEKRKRLIPTREMLDLTRQHPSVEARNAARGSGTTGEFAALERSAPAASGATT